jgi:hypothetical protein
VDEDDQRSIARDPKADLVAVEGHLLKRDPIGRGLATHR